MYETLIRISINILKMLYGLLGAVTIIIIASLTEIAFETSFDKELGIVVGVVSGIWAYDKLKNLKLRVFGYIETVLGVE